MQYCSVLKGERKCTVHWVSKFDVNNKKAVRIYIYKFLILCEIKKNI